MDKFDWIRYGGRKLRLVLRSRRGVGSQQNPQLPSCRRRAVVVEGVRPFQFPRSIMIFSVTLRHWSRFPSWGAGVSSRFCVSLRFCVWCVFTVKAHHGAIP
jgi:hypothetical protein